jgi:hypothetical protein
MGGDYKSPPFYLAGAEALILLRFTRRLSAALPYKIVLAGKEFAGRSARATHATPHNPSLSAYFTVTVSNCAPLTT